MAKPVAITPEADVERTLRLTIAREPANAEAMAALARLLGRHGAVEESIALYETVAALRPDWFDILDELACVCIRRKDLIAADLWLSRIPDPARQARRIEVRRWMRKEAKRLMLLAREHEAQGRTDEAFAAYALMAGHAPDLVAWRIEAARFFLAVGRYEAAQAHLETLDGDERIPALLEAASALRQSHPRRRSAAFVSLLYTTAQRQLQAGRAALAEPVFREVTLIEPLCPHA